MNGPLLAVLALQLPAAVSPRPPYWQQGVRYEIHASLDEAAGVLSGTQRMVYINHSPDTLRTVSFHLHLNAFRPGSRWADADSVERRRRFNHLRDPDYGFNHVRNARIMGEAIEPTWPFAPDSTVARYPLPRPLAPGDSMTVDLDWDARPSTVPRRQGRQGRRFDFAQSYPKVVVYDRYGWNEHPLYPGGEFYGEFATYLVDLDLAEDQVIAATGVPICGDPGWARANQVPGAEIEYQRDWYPDAPRFEARGPNCVATVSADAGAGLPPIPPRPPRPMAQGRKRVVWYAENVHHWAASLNPGYRYEGGYWGDVAIHVLYQPGDEATWGNGIAVQRTAIALRWLDGFYGKFGWPQISNVHRIEGGGTEFPMMVHDGSPSQGLIVHELGHNYTMGLLANNEWREGWLDEGFTEFQGAMFDEVMEPRRDIYREEEAFLTGMDLDGESEPASLISEDYRDFASYNISIYSRGALFFHRLRYVVGDEALLRIMRTFYARWMYHHVDEAAFREVAEEVSGRDLSTLFGQQLHGTPLVDYAIGRVQPRPLADSAGRWETRVEVVRKAPGRLPVEVWVLGESDTAVVRTDGLAEREWVTVMTRSKPKAVLLDPRVRTGDWNMLNNSWRRGWLWPSREPKRERYFDTWFSQRTARDHRTVGLLPTVWYNDAAGFTVGLRSREDYFGRFEQNLTQLSWGTGWASARDVNDMDFWFRVRNPTWLRGAGLSETAEAFNVDGRYGARLALQKVRKSHFSFGPVRTYGATLTWLQPDDFRYLDRGQYDDTGTVELQLGAGVRDLVNGWALAANGTAAGGLAYHRAGLATATGRSDLDPFYTRITAEGTARGALSARLGLALRVYAGLATSGEAPVKQRQIYVAGADPLEQLSNPFLRSTGALLVRPDLNYHAPGGGDLRGFDPNLSGGGLAAANLELERTLRQAGRGHGGFLFRRLTVALFADLGHSFGPATTAQFLADAGLGIRGEHRIGQTTFTTRADFPLWVNRPELAQDAGPGADRAGFRWSFSFTPAW